MAGAGLAFAMGICPGFTGLPITGASPPKDCFFARGTLLMIPRTSTDSYPLPEDERVVLESPYAVVRLVILLRANSSAACVATLLLLNALPGLFE